MSEDRLKAELLFHILLFAYQKVVRDILGSGSQTFVRPTLDAIKKAAEALGVDITKGTTVDEVFENYTKMLQNAGLVKEARLEKVGPEKYVLHINGCTYAKRVHAALKPKDSTCRYALIAMAILGDMYGKEVKIVNSTFLEEGTETSIECQSGQE